MKKLKEAGQKPWAPSASDESALGLGGDQNDRAQHAQDVRLRGVVYLNASGDTTPDPGHSGKRDGASGADAEEAGMLVVVTWRCSRGTIPVTVLQPFDQFHS